MRRLVLPLLLLAALTAAAEGGAAVGGGRGFRSDDYDDDGNLRYTIEAAAVKPSADDPQILQATDVRLTTYHKGMKHVVSARKGVVDIQKRNAALEGDVVIVFGGDEATRVATERLFWIGAEGMATTEDPTQQPEQLLANPRIPVTISRADMTTEALGLQLWLREARGAKRDPKRVDRLVLGRRVRTVLRPAKASWLLSAAEAKRRPGAERKPEGPKPKEAKKEAKAKEPGKEPPKPAPPEITITCTGPLTLYREDVTAVYENNVRVVQGQQSLTCDRLTVALREANPGAAPPGGNARQPKVYLDSVTAAGSVRIDNATTVAFADLAVWHQKDGFAMLTGCPARVRWDNGNEIRAGRIRRMADGDVLDCSATEDYPRSVYFITVLPAEPVVAPKEKADATGRAAADR